jgi:hypothetical protein
LEVLEIGVGRLADYIIRNYPKFETQMLQNSVVRRISHGARFDPQRKGKTLARREAENAKLALSATDKMSLNLET